MTTDNRFRPSTAPKTTETQIVLDRLRDAASILDYALSIARAEAQTAESRYEESFVPGNADAMLAWQSVYQQVAHAVSATAHALDTCPRSFD